MTYLMLNVFTDGRMTLTLMCPQGRTPRMGKALGGKPGARTLKLPSTVWASELRDAGYCRGSLTLRRLMSCIYGAPILDVSRSHTTTQHSR